MNLIELRNVSAFRGQTLALKNLNLSLALGESHAILGPNGAGKSSFIKLITRELYPVEKPTSEIKVLGKTQVNIWELRQEIGIVSNDFQNNYRSSATGLDVVISAFFGSVGVHGHQTITDTMLTQASNALKQLSIEHLSKRRYLNLSTGEQRRLLLARALVHKPKALLLDEPTAGLDLKARFWFINKIRELCNKGITIVLVTHELSEIPPEIHNITMLKNGEILITGSKAEVVSEANISELYDVKINLNSSSDGFIYAAPKQ